MVDGSTFYAGVRVLARGVRMRPLPFVTAVAGGLLYGGMTVVAALVVGRVTDDVVLPAFDRGSTDGAALLAGAATILGVAVAKALGIVGRRVGGSWMQLTLHVDTRRLLTRRYLALPMSWHRRRPTGELLSTANADVDATWGPVAPMPMSLGVLFMLLVAGAVLVTSDPYMAAVGFVTGPAVALLNWRYTRAYRIPAGAAQAQRGRVSAIAHESFDGATVVKTLGLEAAEVQRFAAESDALRDELIKLGRIRAAFDALDAVPQLGILLVVAVGAWRARAGLVTSGEVVQFAYLFAQVALPMRVIGYLLGEMPRSVVGWERVSAVLSATGDTTFGKAAWDEGVTGVPANGSAEQVSFRYSDERGGRRALSGLTVDLAAGTVVAVVGPTGSGKSTLAGLWVRLSDPDSGRVLLDGVDLREAREGAVAGVAALAFQESFLFDDTVRDNVTMAEPFDDERIWAALSLAQADGFVRALPKGLDTRLGERGTTLSGGQRQRIALARALVRRPRLLVMDDATSSVDVGVEAAILKGLKHTDLGATVLLVAHRRASIELSDEVLFLVDGEIMARGPHAVLLSEVPAYRELLQAYAAEEDAA